MKNKIPIKNIYYLLSYAWDRLDSCDQKDLSEEAFSCSEDLLGRMLTNGVIHLSRRGFLKQYVSHGEESSLVKGKVDLAKSVKNGSIMRSKVFNHFDFLTEDNLYNQVLKASLRKLLKFKSIHPSLSASIIKIIRDFHNVKDISLTDQVFSSCRIDRFNRHYRFPLDICRLIHENCIVSEEDGLYRFFDFTQDPIQMRSIFEEFIRNFYIREQRSFKVYREQISWNIHPENDESFQLLPKMNTDISLYNDRLKIIIDTKFYINTFQEYFGTKKVHSANLYQMMSYLSNSLVKDPIPHWGILLYPTVNQEAKADYKTESSKISVRSIDLSKEWNTIHNSLIDMISESTKLKMDC